MTTVHFRRITDETEALALLRAAMAARHPVTVGFGETRRELRPVKKRDGSIVEEWCPVRGQMVTAVRTLEPFNIEQTSAGNWIMQAMDRCPRNEKDWGNAYGPPAIRTVRLDRITDITVHVKSGYALRNEHFLTKVREHATAYGYSEHMPTTDTALWELIQDATSRENAEEIAFTYAIGKV